MKKILIIDDDIAILDALKIILDDAGYEVVTCNDGRKAMEEIQSLTPDLLLLDIWMSGKDGLEIAKEVKQHEKTKGTPIIMISALTDGQKVTKKLGLDFLMKPFTIKDILTKIHTYLPSPVHE